MRLARLAALAAFIGGAVAAQPAGAAVTTDNFQLRTTQDLVTLCDAQRGDPNAAAAVQMCQGFLVGIYQYHEALTTGRSHQPPVFCIPADAGVTRDGGTRMFVEWARTRPQHMAERPIDGVIRWAVETWPCPRPAARTQRRAPAN